MENDLRTMVERNKIKAEGFSKNNIKAFIEDIKNNYYFCNIISIDDISVFIENFSGIREGEKERLFFVDIIKFEEYKER